MRSDISIWIDAPPERVYPLVADLSRWKERLPHYRYVRRIPDAERHFEMGARRGPIPVRWRAIQRPIPERRTIEFVHTGGVTRGMAVAWRFEDRGDGLDVSIEHELKLAWPLIGDFAAERVIGPHFIDAIAGRTLRRVKELAEAGSR